jgi:hypothetical protein
MSLGSIQYVRLVRYDFSAVTCRPTVCIQPGAYSNIFEVDAIVGLKERSLTYPADAYKFGHSASLHFTLK